MKRVWIWIAVAVVLWMIGMLEQPAGRGDEIISMRHIAESIKW